MPTGDIIIGSDPDPLLYIALDVETTGPRPGTDSLLSLGAHCVTRINPILWGGRFYIEIKPTSLDFYHEAVKVGASELDALKPVMSTPKLCPSNPFFEPRTTLVHLQDSGLCTYAPTAMRKFAEWIDNVGRYKQVRVIVDTTFFDSGWFNYVCAEYGEMFPLFGHRGIDLRSYWAGMTMSPEAKLSTIGVKEKNPRPHHAGHDAAHLAETARVLFYEKLDELRTWHEAL